MVVDGLRRERNRPTCGILGALLVTGVLRKGETATVQKADLLTTNDTEQPEPFIGARVKLEGDGKQVFLMRFPKLTCPLLNPDGKCSVYEDRPAICRIWGAVEKMKCPHGCRPKKWMTRDESYAVLAATESIP